MVNSVSPLVTVMPVSSTLSGSSGSRTKVPTTLVSSTTGSLGSNAATAAAGATRPGSPPTEVLTEVPRMIVLPGVMSEKLVKSRGRPGPSSAWKWPQPARAAALAMSATRPAERRRKHVIPVPSSLTSRIRTAENPRSIRGNAGPGGETSHRHSNQREYVYTKRIAVKLR